MLDKLNNLKKFFAKPKAEPIDNTPKKERKSKVKEEKVISEKEKATAAGEPYVAILKVDIDPKNVQNGSFELDWNSIFITQLVKAGYMKKKEDADSDIVDRWFSDICRNVVLENFEQLAAMNPPNSLRPISSRNLGDGRTEIS